MKAIVQNAYGGPEVLALAERPKPAPTGAQVLIQVQASCVNAGDLFTVRGSPWMIRFTVGFPRPKGFVPGWDVAGRVVAVGPEATRFKPGDAVFGGCEHAFAEYVVTGEDKLSPLPAGMGFGPAATLPTAATTALQALRDHGRLQPGHRVLINGATGGVGHFSVQIAHALGAEVTAVCSGAKVDLVRSLGAAHVIDYTRDDFTRSPARYDLILDNVASRSFSDMKRALAPGGLIQPNSGHGGMAYVFRAFALSAFSRRVGRPFMAVPNTPDLEVIKGYCEAGKLTPVIDATYPLAEAAQAVAHLAQGHARGKVVIAVGEG